MPIHPTDFRVEEIVRGGDGDASDVVVLDEVRSEPKLSAARSNDPNNVAAVLEETTKNSNSLTKTMHVAIRSRE